MGYRAAEEYTIINYISYSCCSQRHVALEHTKPLFNKHNLLTLHNLYTSRSSLELIKILKLHSPYPVYENLQFCPRTHHFRLLSPKYNLDISKNKYFISSVNLWNKCISKLLDNPDLLSSSHRSHLIIPGHNVNSDLTIPMGTFKNRMKNFLLKTKNLGITSDWYQQFFICLTCIKIISCGFTCSPQYLYIIFSSYFILII